MEIMRSSGSLRVTIDERNVISKLEELTATDRTDEPLFSGTSQRVFKDYLLSTEVYHLDPPHKHVS